MWKWVIDDPKDKSFLIQLTNHIYYPYLEQIINLRNSVCACGSTGSVYSFSLITSPILLTSLYSINGTYLIQYFNWYFLWVLACSCLSYATSQVSNGPNSPCWNPRQLDLIPPFTITSICLFTWDTHICAWQMVLEVVHTIYLHYIYHK